jgi:hypothetical protein
MTPPLKDPQWKRKIERLELVSEDLVAAAARLDRIDRDEIVLSHPAYLLHDRFVKCVDSRSGEVFEFELFNASELRRGLRPGRLADIGIDPVSAGAFGKVGGWGTTNASTRRTGAGSASCSTGSSRTTRRSASRAASSASPGSPAASLSGTCSTSPGTDVLVFSIGEDEAKEVIERIWGMFLSLQENPEKRTS